MLSFNRYVVFRMVIEMVGAIACTTMITLGNTLVGVTVTGIIALIWIIGEIWVVSMLKQDPRRDELSDEHQRQAAQFSLITISSLLVVIGFVLMIAGLVAHSQRFVSPMLLPTIAMVSLALADARYLWLEHSDNQGGDDED